MNSLLKNLGARPRVRYVLDTANPGLLEVLFWWLAAALVVFPELAALLLDGRGSLRYFFTVGGARAIISVTIFFFPHLFRLIFNAYPIAFFLAVTRYRLPPDAHGPGPGRPADAEGAGAHAPATAEGYLQSLVAESKELSEKIYRRSGAYLLVGCLIALTGVLFFYSQSLPGPEEPQDIWARVVALAPRFGILFFIELIAFFFLKQYRITMDEFRHYELLKRQRESNLAIFRLVEFKKDQPEQLKTLMEAVSFFQNPDRLGKEETTQLLEARKFSNEEINVLGKIIEVIGRK